MQQLMQTYAKMEIIGSSAAKSGTDDTPSGCEQERSSIHLPVTDDEHFLLYTTGVMSLSQYDRDIRKHTESIRTWPGILDITKMKRTATDYGRCTVNNLQRITRWDDESKVDRVRPVIQECLLDRGEMLMQFVGTSEREVPSVRYEKAGRLRPGDNGVIEAIRDGYGEIQSLPTGDVILTLNGLPVDGISVSESGKMIEISGTDGRKYLALVKQVRWMIRDWPKGKGALFVVEERGG